MVPKRGRPPRPRGRGLSGAKAKKAPRPLPRGPRWSHSEGGPRVLAERASVVPKRGRPSPRPCGGGVNDPKQRGPRALAAGASAVPKRKRPPRPCGGGLCGPKAKELSTGGLHYTILRLIIYITTLLNTYISQYLSDKQIRIQRGRKWGGWRAPLNTKIRVKFLAN